MAIDALRGVAVLMVLASHLLFASGTSPSPISDEHPATVFPDWSLHVALYGQYGVHLFLVLSGFCIHMAWARSESSDGISFFGFWKRRLHRLYPPYFVALLASIAGLYVFHGVLGGASGSLGARLGYSSTGAFASDFASLVLLVQNLNGAAARIGNGPFWTLALEEQLYLLYFALLWMRRKRGWKHALVMVVAVTMTWRFAALVIPEGTFRDVWDRAGPARWIEWMLGAIAVEAYLERVRLPRWASSAPVGLLLLAAGIADEELSKRFDVLLAFVDILFGAGFFVLVNAACRTEWGVRKDFLGLGRRLAWVGAISYSLYLTHAPILAIVKAIGMRAGLGTTAILAVRAVAPVVAAWVFYQLVEKRFLHASRTLAEAAEPSAEGVQIS